MSRHRRRDPWDRDDDGNRPCWEPDRAMDPQKLAQIVADDGKGCGSCWWRFASASRRVKDYPGCTVYLRRRKYRVKSTHVMPPKVAKTG